ERLARRPLPRQRRARRDEGRRRDRDDPKGEPAALSDIFEWLVAGAPGASVSEEVVERLADGLVAEGVPLDRLAVFVTTLHPTVLGRQFRWAKDEPGSKTILLTPEIQRSDAFAKSPLTTVKAMRRAVHRRLEEPLAPEDYGVLH